MTDSGWEDGGEFPELRVESRLWGEGTLSSAPDVVLMLHPWPYISPERTTSLGALRRFTRRVAARYPGVAHWMLSRTLELYSLHPAASATRRCCGAIGSLLAGPVRVIEESLLRSRVDPLIAGAQRWNGEAPCAHTAPVKVFSRPRRISICPTCGMGLTAPDALPAEVDSGDYYGEGYATRGKFIGWREFERAVGEESARLAEAIDALLPEASPRGSPIDRPVVLDYGCGNGRFAALWIRRGHAYVGIEPSERSVEFARRLAQRQQLAAATFEVGSLEAATSMAPAGGFSVIFMSHVLEHLADPVAVLSDLRRLSRPGAHLFVEVPNAFSYTWSRRFRGFGNFEHTWDFTPAMLMATARAAGWNGARNWCHPDPERHPYVAMLACHPG